MPVKNYALYAWINDNNPSEELEYRKGWWDYVELLQRLATKLDADEVRVVGTYIVDTPPPAEQLTMPAVAFELPHLSFAVRFDFGANPTRDFREWIVSVNRRGPYRGPLFGLIDPDEDLRPLGVSGLGGDWLFGSYRENAARFMCALEDEWDVWALVRLLGHEA
jgi:hypothetical protein